MTNIGRPARDAIESFRDRKWKESLAKANSTGSTGIYSKPFIMLNNDSDMTAERSLAGSADIDIIDNGANSSVVIGLKDTTVTAGSYTTADITVDAKGRITAASNGSAAGETNTASNVGAGGVGLFKQKTGVDLEFKNINAGSSKVTITDDTTNDEVDIDVDESKFSLVRHFLFGSL